MVLQKQEQVNIFFAVQKVLCALWQSEWEADMYRVPKAGPGGRLSRPRVKNGPKMFQNWL
jgi:hypothetical protein